MPPRKKARASAASTPLTETLPRTPQESGPSQARDQTSPPHDHILNDPWKDEEETQLFKSMIKWKPTGLHKHFRMISIHNNMRSHGFVTPNTPHTRIPGIWDKLNQLYDLNALDERENAHAFANDPDPFDPEEESDVPEFHLPEDEFGEMMWQRRFHGPESDRSSSPPLIPTEEVKSLYAPGAGLLSDLPDGEGYQKIKDEAAAASTPAPKSAKGGARTSRSAAKARATKTAQPAKNAKESTVSESAEDEEEEDEDEDESGESEEETAPTTRKMARSTAKTRPTPRSRRKR